MVVLILGIIKTETIFSTLPSVCPHVVHTDVSPFSAAFHAYGKPGKTLVETRQVLSLIHYTHDSVSSACYDLISYKLS